MNNPAGKLTLVGRGTWSWPRRVFGKQYMTNKRRRASCVACGIWLAGLIGLPAVAQPPRIRKLPTDALTNALGRQYLWSEVLQHGRRAPAALLRPPLVFETNVGQAAEGFDFVLRSVGFAAGFSRQGITAAVFHRPSSAERSSGSYATKGHAIQLVLQKGDSGKIRGEKPASGVVRIARGSDGAQNRAPIPSFNSIVYPEVYSGIQMVVHARDGRLEYGFDLGPAAPLSAIRIRVRGVSSLSVDGRGHLLMRTPSGTIVQTRPRFYEHDRRGRRLLKGSFAIRGATEYGFQVTGRTPGTRLLVDPEIVFTSYFGGGGTEGTIGPDNGGGDLHGQGFDVALGPDGNLFVVGSTTSTDFPVTAAGPLGGSTDAFVLRLDPTLAPGQQLVYATFLGGSSFERGVSVSARGDNAVYVVGCTTSGDFPTTPGVVQPAPAESVGYIALLLPDGALEAATLLGTTIDHHPASVVFSKRATETEGFVYVGGSVAQPPAGATGDAVPGGFQIDHHGGGFDGFVAKLDASLSSFEYLTYVGGARQDLVMDLAVNDGFAFVTGSTTSFDFPTTELAVQSAHSQAVTGVDCGNVGAARQCFDAFVTRVARTGASLIYSTYLGGDHEEFGRGLAIAGGNQATLTGAARPTTGTDTDIFVTRLEGGGENVLWDERLPGSRRDHGEEVVVDALGRAHVVGTVSRDGLSTSDTSFHGGAGDIFYSRHAAATGDKEFFTYLGGAADDRGFAVAAEGDSAESFCAFAAGSTTSEDVVTVNPLEGGEENRGGADLLLFALCDIDASIEPGSGFTKAANPATVTSGQGSTFTITVVNGGDVPAAVVVTDTVPDAFIVTGVTGPGCSHSANSVSCAFSAAPGATTFVVATTAGAQCPRTVTNTATIQVGSRSFSTSAQAQVVCAPPLCPNGVLNPGEECDSEPGCRSNCTRIECGDGIVDPGEQCDDGDNSNNDACTNNCRRQLTDGQTCSSGSPACAGDLVCGRRCSVVEECEFIIFCDTYWLCSTPDECMPADDATFTSNP